MVRTKTSHSSKPDGTVLFCLGTATVPVTALAIYKNTVANRFSRRTSCGTTSRRAIPSLYLHMVNLWDGCAEISKRHWISGSGLSRYLVPRPNQWPIVSYLLPKLIHQNNSYNLTKNIPHIHQSTVLFITINLRRLRSHPITFGPKAEEVGHCALSTS